MDWTWDPNKAASNIIDHGVSFEAAVIVFDDPFQLNLPDPHPDGDRWRTIGVVNVSTLFVVHTLIEDEGRGRIISARRATRSERKVYEEQSRD